MKTQYLSQNTVKDSVLVRRVDVWSKMQIYYLYFSGHIHESKYVLLVIKNTEINILN